MERKRVVLDCSNDKSRTQQHFRDAADINNIVSKFMKSGVLGDPTRRSSRAPMWGDFSNVDFQSSMEMVASVKNGFELLSSEIRSKFDNNPSNLLEFLSDPENRDEAVKLGLLPPLPPKVVEDVPEAAAAASVDPDADAIEASADKAIKAVDDAAESS